MGPWTVDGVSQDVNGDGVIVESGCEDVMGAREANPVIDCGGNGVGESGE